MTEQRRRRRCAIVHSVIHSSKQWRQSVAYFILCIVAVTMQKAAALILPTVKVSESLRRDLDIFISPQMSQRSRLIDVVESSQTKQPRRRCASTPRVLHTWTSTYRTRTCLMRSPEGKASTVNSSPRHRHQKQKRKKRKKRDLMHKVSINAKIMPPRCCQHDSSPRIYFTSWVSSAYPAARRSLAPTAGSPFEQNSGKKAT